MSIKKGTTISHYKVLAEVGKGGMGEVYLAHDTKLDRKVALKILPEPYTTDSERMHRFSQEAKAASRLNHPNIITIYEFSKANNIHYISSEFIKGDPLNKRLSGHPLRLKEALEIAIQIASALDIAHSNGIVHRDIKPQNIMIRPDGLVKVLDFGIAKLTERDPDDSIDLEAETALSMKTSAGTVMGTAAYMSPEQARGKEVDARSDIFSFGIILYEMVSGRLPFFGENELDIIASILHKEPKPLTQVSKRIPREIERIINRTLQKDKQNRYQTIKNLLQDLREVKQELEFQNKLGNTIPNDKEEPKTKIIGSATRSENIQNTSEEEQLPGRAKIRRPIPAVFIVLILLAAVTSIGYFSYTSSNKNTNNEPIGSLAILPFANVDQSPENDYLSDGLTESIIYNLSKITKLRVLPSSTIFRYKGKETNAKKVGDELKVRAVLVSRIEQRGNNFLISTELIDTWQNKIIWGQRYNRKISDTLKLQKEISTEISERLRLKLSGAEEEGVAKDYTTNNEAYQAYLRGRFQWNKRTKEGLIKGIEYFNSAIEMDPNYAQAWSGLADCYILLPEYSSTPQKEAMPKGKMAAKKAIELDPNLAEAHTSLAYVLTSYEWKLAEAEEELKMAIKLNPDYSTAHQWYGIVLELTGRFEEAIGQGERALKLEPLSRIVNFSTGYRYLNARKYEKAIQQFRNSLEIYPDFAPGHRRLGFALALKGRYDEAIAELEKAQKISGFSRQGAIAYVHALSGKKDLAQSIIAREVDNPKKDPRDIAITFIQLGQYKEALKWLEMLYKNRDDRILYLKISPFYDDIRNEPGYTDLIKRIGLTE